MNPCYLTNQNSFYSLSAVPDGIMKNTLLLLLFCFFKDNSHFNQIFGGR